MNKTPKSKQNADGGSMMRLVRDLTGLTPRKRDKILRMIDQLEDELDNSGLVMFSGNCTDQAILMHRETGIVLGRVDNLGVFLGGDIPTHQTADGIEYSYDISPTSGDFANAGSDARRAGIPNQQDG
jgi:hypothetical protein